MNARVHQRLVQVACWPIVTGLLLLGVCQASAQSAQLPVAPELPRSQIETAYPASGGRLLRLNAKADLQVALNMAVPGDTIELQAGAVYNGPFRLPLKEGDGWIVIRSSRLGELPEEGTRVRPGDAALMPVLQADAGAVILAAPGAHHYRFVGLEIRPEQGAHLDNLVLLSGGPKSLETMPHHIIFDRCYLHGDPEVGTRRGIALNSGASAIIDSYLSDFKARGPDSQAIAGWGGTGPYLIRNNYLEGAGENVMFGGADPRIESLVPSDIEVSGNHFAKPLTWKEGYPGFEGPSWTIKNLFELKNARRVLIEGNLFEHHWPQAQNGFSILFTVRNQENSAPWSVVEDVTFRHNVIRHVSDGINILGVDDNYPSGQTARIAIHNNLFQDVGSDWGRGRLLQLLRGVHDLSFTNNTAFQIGSIIFAEGERSQRVAMTGNKIMHNLYGISGTGTGVGNATLEQYFHDLTLQNNALVGAPPTNYPPGNEFPAQLEQADDAEYGVDFDSLCAALSPTERLQACHQGD